MRNEKCVICGKEFTISQRGREDIYFSPGKYKRENFCSEVCYNFWCHQEAERDAKKMKKKKRLGMSWDGWLLQLVCELPIMVIVIIVIAIIFIAGG